MYESYVLSLAKVATVKLSALRFVRHGDSVSRRVACF